MSQEKSTGKEILTPKEAARVAGVSIQTIYRWIYAPKGLPVQRPGGNGHYRILKSDLLIYLQGGSFNQDDGSEGSELSTIEGSTSIQ